MDDFDDKLQAFVAKVTADLATYYAKNYPSLTPSIASPRWGQKYVKVDIVNDGGKGQRSGRYMVDVLTGEIFGIKAYGVIHRGHQYGTLDTINNYYWGNYYPQQPGRTPGESLAAIPTDAELAEAVQSLRELADNPDGRDAELKTMVRDYVLGFLRTELPNRVRELQQTMGGKFSEYDRERLSDYYNQLRQLVEGW